MTHWHKFSRPQINRLPTFQRRFSPNTSKLRNCEIRTSFIFKARVSNKSHQSFPIFFRLKQRASERAPPFPLVFQETRESFEIRTSFLPSPRRGTRARLPWRWGLKKRNNKEEELDQEFVESGRKFSKEEEKNLLWPMCTLFIHE